MRDVSVWRGIEHEFLVVSDEPEASGELLTLERVVNGTLITIEVSVIESHPEIVNGSVRHRLRLRSSEAINGSEPRAAARAH